MSEADLAQTSGRQKPLREGCRTYLVRRSTAFNLFDHGEVQKLEYESAIQWNQFNGME
jgi:hypothetical protein